MKPFFKRFFPHDEDATLSYHYALQRRLNGVRRMLDFGCGDHGTLAPYRALGWEVWGTDFQAHPQLVDPTWFRPLRPAGVAPFPDGSFDLIGARWVLEHVEQPECFLREVVRLLRPGGWMVALTLNAGHYVTWLSRFMSLLPHALTQRLVWRLYGRPPHDTFLTWYRMNTQAGLRRLARRAGLEVAQIERFANADYFSFSPLLHRGAVLVDWLLEESGTDLGRLYMIVTLRKPACHGASLQSDPRQAG